MQIMQRTLQLIFVCLAQKTAENGKYFYNRIHKSIPHIEQKLNLLHPTDDTPGAAYLALRWQDERDGEKG